MSSPNSSISLIGVGVSSVCEITSPMRDARYPDSLVLCFIEWSWMLLLSTFEKERFLHSLSTSPLSCILSLCLIVLRLFEIEWRRLTPDPSSIFKEVFFEFNFSSAISPFVKESCLATTDIFLNGLRFLAGEAGFGEDASVSDFLTGLLGTLTVDCFLSLS